jgi:putative chitinase
MNAEQLQRLHIGPEWVDALDATFKQFKIFSPKEQAAFVGQCSHECGNFRTLEENLNYRAETLCKLWPKRFPTLDFAKQYERNPQKIANSVYSNRMGNRDEKSGDGYRFRGRGCIQLTGHDSYWHCGQALGQDFVMNPDLVKTPMYAAMSAGWFWSTHKCGQFALAGDDAGLCKRINGGLFGLQERVHLTNQAYAVFTGA